MPAKLTTATFIERAKQKHGNKYDYSKSKYISSVKKIEIICKRHGPFFQLPSQHITVGQGCYHCGRDSIAAHRQRDTKDFIAHATKKHGHRYDYSKVEYKESLVKVKIKCRLHGIFLQSPASHLQGHGCPSCRTNMPYSKIAVRWINDEAKRLKLKDVRHAENGGEYTIPGTTIRVDGYHPKTKTVFEFHGDLFHGNPKTCHPFSRPHPFIKRKTAVQLLIETKAREKRIRQMGYNLITIWESDYKRRLKSSFE